MVWRFRALFHHLTGNRRVREIQRRLKAACNTLRARVRRSLERLDQVLSLVSDGKSLTFKGYIATDAKMRPPRHAHYDGDAVARLSHDALNETEDANLCEVFGPEDADADRDQLLRKIRVVGEICLENVLMRVLGDHFLIVTVDERWTSQTCDRCLGSIKKEAM